MRVGEIGPPLPAQSTHVTGLGRRIAPPAVGHAARAPVVPRGPPRSSTGGQTAASPPVLPFPLPPTGEALPTGHPPPSLTGPLMLHVYIYIDIYISVNVRDVRRYGPLAAAPRTTSLPAPHVPSHRSRARGRRTMPTPRRPQPSLSADAEGHTTHQLANRRSVRRRAIPNAPRQLATSPSPASGPPGLFAAVDAMLAHPANWPPRPPPRPPLRRPTTAPPPLPLPRSPRPPVPHPADVPAFDAGPIAAAHALARWGRLLQPREPEPPPSAHRALAPAAPHAVPARRRSPSYRPSDHFWGAVLPPNVRPSKRGCGGTVLL